MFWNKNNENENKTVLFSVVCWWTNSFMNLSSIKMLKGLSNKYLFFKISKSFHSKQNNMMFYYLKTKINCVRIDWIEIFYLLFFCLTFEFLIILGIFRSQSEKFLFLFLSVLFAFPNISVHSQIFFFFPFVEKKSEDKRWITHFLKNWLVNRKMCFDITHFSRPGLHSERKKNQIDDFLKEFYLVVMLRNSKTSTKK